MIEPVDSLHKEDQRREMMYLADICKDRTSNIDSYNDLLQLLVIVFNRGYRQGEKDTEELYRLNTGI